jgi:hypothetical protein
VPERTPALMLGARVRFQDCWAGKVTSIEITEDWEVYNVAVRHGFLKPVTTRLPWTRRPIGTMSSWRSTR